MAQAGLFVLTVPLVYLFALDLLGSERSARLACAWPSTRAKYFIVERNNPNSAAGWEASSFAAADPQISREIGDHYRLETTIEDFVVSASREASDCRRGRPACGREGRHGLSAITPCARMASLI